MKKRLGLLLISILMLNNLAFAAPETFEGHAEFDDEYSELDEKMYTGKTETLEKRDTIEMTVSQVLDGSFSFEGDEFFAEVTSDVIGDKGVIIPKGTVAHGVIKETSEAKRFGRDGYLDLSFDYLVTPDGREIPIEGKMSTKLHPIKAATKIVATDIGYTAIGGLAGGVLAAQALGIEAAIASQGYTLAGGAAIGSAVGLGMSLYRKGKNVLISPGDEIKVKIVSSEPIQVMTHESVRQDELEYEGLEVDISDVFLEKDPFDHLNTISLDLIIKNNSKSDFSGT